MIKERAEMLTPSLQDVGNLSSIAMVNTRLYCWIKKIALREISSFRIGLNPTEASYPKIAIIKRQQ
jgi:hypothetical protein